jgi:DNA-binding Lrp family transcriptional regulator
MAFVFVNAEVGSEDETLKQLRKIGNVKEAYSIYGIYDIVAKVEAETTDSLREVITSKMRKLRTVRSTLTMMVIE